MYISEKLYFKINLILSIGFKRKCQISSNIYLYRYINKTPHTIYPSLPQNEEQSFEHHRTENKIRAIPDII